MLCGVSRGLLVEAVCRQPVDFYKQLSSPLPQQLYKSMVQACAAPSAVSSSLDWKLLSVLKSTGMTRSRAGVKVYITDLGEGFVLPFWMVEQQQICRPWTFSFLPFRVHIFSVNPHPLKLHGKAPTHFKRQLELL